jgi:hypothetical protein
MDHRPIYTNCRHCEAVLVPFERRVMRQVCLVCDATNADRRTRHFSPWASLSESMTELALYETLRGGSCQMYAMAPAQGSEGKTVPCKPM